MQETLVPFLSREFPLEILQYSWASLVIHVVSNLGTIPALERSPGGGDSNPLQYSCLEDPMDREAWWAIVHGSQRAGHD